MVPFDPTALAARQLARDTARTARFPGLLERKIARMSASPLAFLRGAAPLFYDMLAARPSLASGPRGEGWIAGDLHLENFGAYRPQDHSASATFNLNDFDDAVVAPWRLDVLRLMTSLILGGRELGADGPRAIGLCDRLLVGYVASACGAKRPPAEPRPVQALIEQARNRSHRALLDARTTLMHGKRRFVRGERYRDLPRAVATQVPAAFRRYVDGFGKEWRPDDDELEILDIALRIAGTGSLGGLRVAVLVRGKGGHDGAWIFDMKEQGEPSPSILVGKPKGDPALRVATAVRACLEHPPRAVGTTKLGKLSMFVRRLAPQEDKLDLSHIRDADIEPLASYLGSLVGAAHRRGAKAKSARAWTVAECDALVDRAITVAGVHEAVYLAFCKLTAPKSHRNAKPASR